MREQQGRKSVGSRIAGGQSAGPVAGSERSRKRAIRALVDGRRPGPGKPQSLTRLRGKRSWCFVEVRFVRADAGRETGRQRFSRRPCERPKTPSQWGLRPVGGAWPRISRRGESRAARARAEAGYAPSNACSLGVGSSQGGPAPLATLSRARGPQGPRAGGGEPARGRSRREPRSSGIDRSTGARAVRWLQKSVRSTFSAAPRGAARRTEARRGSVVGRFRNLDKDGIARLPGAHRPQGRCPELARKGGFLGTSAARPAPGAATLHGPKGRCGSGGCTRVRGELGPNQPLARASLTRPKGRGSN